MSDDLDLAELRQLSIRLLETHGDCDGCDLVEDAADRIEQQQAIIEKLVGIIRAADGANPHWVAIDAFDRALIAAKADPAIAKMLAKEGK